MVRDIVHPTLVVFRPPNRKRATHTAVVICPGGGFLWLSIDTDGYDVARALAADGIAAVSYVRHHAAQLGVYPDQIGMLGFSAGGVVTQGAIMHGGPNSRLAFAGLIYGAFKGEDHWPTDTPPIFLAVAGDDPTGAFGGTMRVFESLHEQHHPAELHVFVADGHGFGMQEQGLTSDLWLKEFVDWMAAEGLLRLT